MAEASQDQPGAGAGAITVRQSKAQRDGLFGGCRSGCPRAVARVHGSATAGGWRSAGSWPPPARTSTAPISPPR